MPNYDYAQYVKDALRTDLSPEQYDEACLRMVDNIVIMHALMGLVTEIGECMDVLKRHIFYGAELDSKKLLNLIEEAGDIQWYGAVLANELTPDVAQILEKNISKLKARYPQAFSGEQALNRDLDAENEALQ